VHRRSNDVRGRFAEDFLIIHTTPKTRPDARCPLHAAAVGALQKTISSDN
jgi:hypothetical protein